MKSFRLKNIKSFLDSKEIKLAPITIFVGKNSCGKSSLLRFPAVLSQTFIFPSGSPINLFGGKVDYGNYDEVLNKLSGNGLIEFSITYPINMKLISSYNQLTKKMYRKEKNYFNDVRLSVSFNKKNRHIIVEKLVIDINNQEFCKIEKTTDNKYNFSIRVLCGENEISKSEYKIVLEHTLFDKMFFMYDPGELVSKIGMDIFGTEWNDEYNRFFGKMTEINTLKTLSPKEYSRFEEILLNYNLGTELLRALYNCINFEAGYTHYIGPFRISPSRIYRDTQFFSNDVGIGGENSSTILFNNYKEDKLLNEEISNALKDILGVSLDIKELGEETGVYQIIIRNQDGIESNLIDTGYGISQILPIVVQLLRNEVPPKQIIAHGVVLQALRSLILIEQPELHLHPAAQAAVAELLVKCLQNSNKLKKQILIETHSEHLIRKLQVLVAKGELQISDLKIYYIDKDKHGIANVEEMELLDSGKFKKAWKTGFFDQSFELTMELLNAKH